MKTVTICGSMRYFEEMQKVALQLEIKHNFNVLQCTYNPEQVNISEIEKKSIVAAHLRKIDLSDAIYVLDVDGYIGEAVTEEIAYAKSQGKEVIYHTQFGID